MAGEKNKKNTTKKASSKSSAGKGGALRPWLVLVTVALIIGAYFYAVNYSEDQGGIALSPKVENFQIEKSGAGANVDFTEKTNQIHQLVDELLAQSEANILDVKKQKKMVKRQGIEGNISWSNRQIPVSGTAAQFSKLKKDLETVLDKIDVEIIEIADDTYDGKKAKRIDIGIKDKLAGDTLTIIADKIYFLSVAAKAIDKIQPKAETDGRFKIALVIDDFGYTKEPIAAYNGIDCPLTFAVLPNHPYSLEAAKQGYADGRQIILHLPMEAMGEDAREEPQTIHVSMGESEIRAMVRELTDEVPYIIGVNNHQGSRATSNKAVMDIVLNQLAEQGLFFIDSKTSGSSKAYDIAKKIGLPTAENQLFIDNSSDIKLIKNQLKKAADIARRDGQVIVIGHARPNTAAAIKEMVPELEAKGIKFVFASTLLE